MKKKKYKKLKNYICLGMIERGQRAGLHLDKRKEVNRKICRKKITANDSE
jgi:hypothetical protein